MGLNLSNHRYQGIIRSVEIFNNGISKVTIEGLIDNKNQNFLFYGEINRSISGCVADFRESIELDSLTGSHTKFQMLDVGGGKYVYASTLSQYDAERLRTTLSKNERKRIISEGLTLVG